MNQREVGAKKEEQAGEYLKSCGYELEAKYQAQAVTGFIPGRCQ